MDAKLRKIGIVMSKWAIYALVVCQSIVMVMANETRAQRTLLKDITIEIAETSEARQLTELFKEIEEKSDFSFSFSREQIRGKTLRIKGGEWNMKELLQEVSKQARLSIKRVNESIVLAEMRRSSGLPQLVEQVAQFKIITGTVSDNQGGALPGATVRLKGSSLGTVTNADGTFSLEIEEEGVLVISYVGFISQEVSTNGRSVIDLQLEPDVAALEEIVVVGYGTEEKKDLTGSVATVDSEVVENRQSIQLSDALQGSMAGVTVTRNGAGPGSGSTVRVRGITSLNVNDPLVVVDGVQGLSLDDINPNDVESITVLKDAASQAIYGARAAAGVILVTTKQGKEGEFSINYDYEFGTSSPTELPEYVNAQAYRIIANEYSTNDGGGETFDPVENENYAQLHAQDPDLYPDTDWQDAMFSESPTTRHRHNLAVRAGSKNIRSFASLSYVTEDGIFVNNDFERITFRANNAITLNELIDVNLDVYYKRENTTDPAEGGLNGAQARNTTVSEARRYPGIFPAIRTDGEWGEGKDGLNPLALITDGGANVGNFNSLNGILGITVRPMEGLAVRANFSPTFDFNKANRFYAPPPILRLGSTTEFWPPRDISSITNTQTTVLTLTSQATVTYEKAFGDHNLLLLGGYEEVLTDWDQFTTTSRDLSVELNSLAFGDPSLTQNDQNTSENNIRSFFGRIGYDFRGRYLIQSNLRYDGSSRFAPDERWGFFPSVSAGWVISEERIALPTTISFLKLRGSYGEVGNERIGTSRTGGNEFFNFYPYQELFERVNTVRYDGSNFVAGLGITQDFLADRFLVWETTKTLDFGLDVGLWDDRFSLTTDVYRKETEDIIITQDLPDYLGFPANTKTNVGTVRIEGLEFETGYRDQIGELRYSVGANFSALRSEIIDVGGVETFLVNGNTQIHTEGASFGEWFGFETNGLYQTQADIDGSGIASGFQPGDVWIVDQLTVDTNNDGTPDEGDGVINGEDRVPLGTSLPTFTYGGNIAASYLGFDFSLVFNGVGRHTKRYNNVQVEPLTASFGNVPQYVADATWRPGNSAAQNAAAEFPRYSGASSATNYAVSDFWLYNAEYFRIQNITLGYSLPSSLLETVGLSKIRFYVALRNFVTLKGGDLLDGWDPEVDFNGYPIMRSALFGLNAQF